MMGESETQHTNITQARLKANETLVRYRLETAQLIYEIQSFLMGIQKVTVMTEQGEYFEKDEKYATPKLNQEGIFSLLNRIRMILNPHVVQGNFLTEKWWRIYVADFREDLTIMLMVNAYDWAYNGDIDHFNRNVDSIIDTICELVEPFMTRLIYNKERESYADTMESRETNVVQKSGLFK